MVLRRLQFHLKWQLAHLKSKSIFPSASSLLSFCNWFFRPFPRIFGDKQKHNSFSIYNVKKLCIVYNCVFCEKNNYVCAQFRWFLVIFENKLSCSSFWFTFIRGWHRAIPSLRSGYESFLKFLLAIQSSNILRRP